jgi:DNA-binding GntR family transcriptional regulator
VNSISQRASPTTVKNVFRSRADEVHEQLKRDIAAFRLVPGDRFTETEVSERLGVSRTPVRQALFRLQQEGLVEVQRLCDDARRVDRQLLDDLQAIWLVEPSQRSTDAVQVAEWDEDFHCALVEAAGNAEMARVHRDVTERIRIIRRLDFSKQPRIDATYEEHARILRAVQRKRGDEASRLLRAHIQTSQAEVRKITLHQVYLARQGDGAGR